MAEVVALKKTAALPHILLVEDSASDALLIETAIVNQRRGACQVTHCQTLADALVALKNHVFDVVLLDLSLPDCAEFDALLSIQNMAPSLPVVMLTGHADEQTALAAVQHGAQDYLVKDRMDGEVISRAMQYAMQRKQFEATLIVQANFDPLTGLANRTLFESRLDMALARLKRMQAGLGVFFLDLNRFKPVNDLFGHAFGDQLLIQVAQRMTQSVRPYDTVARFGGDEFALLVEGLEQPRDCAAVAQKILQCLTKPYQISRQQVEVGVSIGIATCFAGDASSRSALLLHADEAMYGAKMMPESNYRFYTQEIHEHASARLRMEHELRNALAKDEFSLYYQPKILLQSGKTTGVEALLRWNHPDRGLLLPGDFMAAVEQSYMAQELGEWVFAHACQDMARWQKNNLLHFRVSVNLSAAEVDDAQLPARMEQCLHSHGLSPSWVGVEVPSSLLLFRLDERLRVLVALRKMGIAVHLDHFGLSAISLAAFQEVPVDGVKIAPQLTQAIGQESGALSQVQVILDIAERFNMDVTAAGIENEQQWSFFKKTRCKEGQGFAVCRPIPSDYLEEWFQLLDKNK